MWPNARYLLELLTHPRSRAGELLRLRKRFAQLDKTTRACSQEERELAEQMRQLRTELCAALGTPRACATCARSYPPPNGRWPGGYCCGTDTWRVFTDDEVVALVVAGTKADRLRPPRTDHAGCVFRGPTGCSIAPGDRPNICLRYLCLDLVAELRARGDLKAIDAQCRKLESMFRRFLQLRSERIEKLVFEQLVSSLAASAGSRPARRR